MCGINGILRIADEAAPIERDELLATREAMFSRGPDDAGEWLAASGRVALAARRLAIQDLSPAGHQPMASADGRFRLVFNGEIYNFAELRRELMAEGARLRSRCDTEVLVEMFARHGVRCLSRLRGMYAFAVWDEVDRRLTLARDPYGIKPLYYSQSNGVFRFASQVKALEAGGKIASAVDPAGLAGFLLWGCVPEPFTIRRRIRCLPAGHVLEIDSGGVRNPRPHYRFDPRPPGDESDVSEAVSDSVRAHLVADVPVGVFLSAGLDSALITACAARLLPQPPETLTLRFAEFAGSPLDEAPGARQVAAALGTKHIERTVERQEFLDLGEAAMGAMDQPSIDGFNTFLVAGAARQAGWKVALSGLGGDELFGGYPSFGQLGRWRRWARLLGRLPFADAWWPRAARLAGGTRPKLAGLARHGKTLGGSYFLRRAVFLPEQLPRLMGRQAAAAGLEAHQPVRYADRALASDRGEPADRADDWLAAHLLESGLYLRNQLLRDGDWASMAHSLELRLPLVDATLRQRVAAAGFRPARGRVRGELLRAAAADLPPAVYDRAKSGFHTPIVAWLRGDRSAGPPARWGDESRWLALEVLRRFGIELVGRDRSRPRAAAR